MPLISSARGTYGAQGVISRSKDLIESVATPFIWLDASKESTISKSGTNVSQWNDSSQNFLNFSAFNSPQYNATGLNSKPTITFNGTSQYLSSISDSISFLSPGYTYFIVGDYTSDGMMMEHTTDANPGSFYFYTITGNSMYYYGPGGQSSNNYTSNWGILGGPTVFVHRFDGTNSGHFVRKAKSTLSGTNNFNNNPGFSTRTGKIFCMSRAGTSLYAGGSVSEIIFYKSALTLSQIQTLENYLYTKWSIT